jgi:hypothetical protein
MIALNAHFDGKVLIPDEPLELPANQKVRIELEPIEALVPTEAKPKRVFGLQPDVITYFAPDWEAPLPDDIWDHNTRITDQGQPQQAEFRQIRA